MVLMIHIRAYILFSTLILEYSIYSALSVQAELNRIEGSPQVYNGQVESHHKSSFNPLHPVPIPDFRKSTKDTGSLSAFSSHASKA